jgi:signal transduction histidine kinase
MFSKILTSIKKRLNMRLAFVFSSLFMFSFLVLFGITYVMLSTSLRRDDRELIRMKLLELWTHYQLGGMLNLRRAVLSGSGAAPGKLFFIRIADPTNTSRFLYLPERWEQLDQEELEKAFAETSGKPFRVRLNGERVYLETASVFLIDGNILQIGINVSSRVHLLSRLRITFAFGMIPLVLLSFVTGSLIAARSLKPIAGLNFTVRSIIATGDISSRISARGRGDELDDLVILFNRMLERIEVLVRGMRTALDSVAHDLRTPMTRLRGSAELALRSSKKAGDYREALEDCLEESELILKMLNTLMDITEAETGAMKLNKSEVNLKSLVTECVDVYRFVSEEKEISLKSSVSPDIAVYADASRIRQAVLNLVDNAIKYTPRGGRVDITVQEEERKVTISVSDTGIGIAEDEQHQIFNRLYRSSHTHSTRGLGLGLSFVQAIVRAHGGEVQVESTPGKGSSFTIILPHKNIQIHA